ncbi:hypothetical protein [Rhodococcus pyridinivorans]|uniref:hypothetical protein n=1 Tax=Rhodococcus pyridinivorans TaxID=103816 RepID=UPI00228462DF|nr:hypothetical protein [Rhodococcus pyridinivorans]WAL49833.1 hypothetical protein OQN32_28035 [Rhodococcus pyridinivorans]
MSAGFGESLEQRLAHDAQAHNAEMARAAAELTNATKAAARLEGYLRECATELSKKTSPRKVMLARKQGWRRPATWSPLGFVLDASYSDYHPPSITLLLPDGRLWRSFQPYIQGYLTVQEEFTPKYGRASILLAGATFEPNLQTGELTASVGRDPARPVDPYSALVDIATKIITTGTGTGVAIRD